MDERHGKRTLAWALLLGLIVPFCAAYFLLGMRFFAVPSNSMLPTLRPADYMVTFRLQQYAPGDIVVLRDPKDANQYVVKRIVAVGGQAVSARGGAIYLNGRYVSEPYLAEPIAYDMPEVLLEEDHVFVLGDNRNASFDSHNWDMDPTKPKAPGKPQSVPAADIVGRVAAIYLPFDRIHRVHAYPMMEVRAG